MRLWLLGDEGPSGREPECASPTQRAHCPPRPLARWPRAQGLQPPAGSLSISGIVAFTAPSGGASVKCSRRHGLHGPDPGTLGPDASGVKLCTQPPLIRFIQGSWLGPGHLLVTAPWTAEPCEWPWLAMVCEHRASWGGGMEGLSTPFPRLLGAPDSVGTFPALCFPPPALLSQSSPWAPGSSLPQGLARPGSVMLTGSSGFPGARRPEVGCLQDPWPPLPWAGFVRLLTLIKGCILIYANGGAMVAGSHGHPSPVSQHEPFVSGPYR